VLSSFDEGVIREVQEAMDTQARQGGEGPMVYVGPERDHFGAEYADAFTEAVESGEGTIVADPEEAEAIVWIGSNKTKLPGMLHSGVRWVQLPSAGVESWVEGLIDAERVYTSAAGVYSKTVAEHALVLMLAGARKLHEATRATSWEVGFGLLLAGSTVVILGARGIGRALIRMLEAFSTRTLTVTRSGHASPTLRSGAPMVSTVDLGPAFEDRRRGGKGR
jgi:phosphoglycerate dehydrogenase-like enzyme